MRLTTSMRMILTPMLLPITFATLLLKITVKTRLIPSHLLLTLTFRTMPPRVATELMIRAQSTVGLTAVPDGRIEGRPGNASRVLGRHGGRASAARSRWSSSAETFGDPALSSVVIPPGASAPVGVIE